MPKLRYCPVLTKVLESSQNQTYCLQMRCAWWDEGAKECQVQSISKGIWEVAENIDRYIQLMVES